MKPARIIQIIGSRMAVDEKQYTLSTTRVFINGDSFTETVRILAKDVKTHIKTGNWHIIDTTNLNSLGLEPLAIQILDNYPLQIKFEKYIETDLIRGEEQFSKILKKAKSLETNK